MPKLSKAQRHERIAAVVAASPSVRIGDLAESLLVATETIRRDLAELEAKGIINRTYGGAVRQVASEPRLAERIALMVRERTAIASIAADTVADKQVLLIGSGATTEHFARQLSTRALNLTVVTNGFGIASAAANKCTCVMITPGTFFAEENAIHGGDTVAYLGTLYADHAFIGASGLTLEGPNDVSPEISTVHRMMIRNAKKTTILADHTKFGIRSTACFARWGEIDFLVTDRPPAGEFSNILSRSKVEVIFPEKPKGI